MSCTYWSNLRNNMDLNDAKLNYMKCHDCLVFVETLFSIAFSALPNDVLKLLIEITLFLKNLCSTTLQEEVLKQMHRNIAITLHKLETIFPPSFFYVIGHLPMYLAEETQLGGPVQYLPMDVSILKVTQIVFDENGLKK